MAEDPDGAGVQTEVQIGGSIRHQPSYSLATQLPHPSD
jgi:hypothetical protein